MGIAEHGKAFRRQLHHQFGTFLAAFRRLVGQAVHQVEIDAVDTGAAERHNGSFGHGVGLNAVDGALDSRVEILHAEAGAVDPARARAAGASAASVRGSISTAISQSGSTMKRERTWASSSFEIGGCDHGRRAAAKMDVADRETAGQAAAIRSISRRSRSRYSAIGS